MKSFRKISGILIPGLVIILSCSQEESLPDLHQMDLPEQKSEVQTTCNIFGSNTACTSSTQTYGVTLDEFSNPSYQWSVTSGNITIIGSSTTSSVTLSFPASFNGGQLYVVVTEGGRVCSDYLNISKVSCPPVPGCTVAPATPYFVTGHGNFCLQNPSADLCVNVDSNVDFYEWKIIRSDGYVINYGRSADRCRYVSFGILTEGSNRLFVRAGNDCGVSAWREMSLVRPSAQQCFDEFCGGVPCFE